ncbi:MAG: hypothetical protein FJX34_01655 [Alphaproteobacteria bacterium]|nr:hypothetical protein [Alphaproteobacteria bacterium]
MKRLFIFLLFFTGDVWSQTLSNQGILNDIVDSDSRFFLKKIEPRITNRLIAEAEFDDNYQATNKQNKFRDTSGAVRYYTNFHLDKHLSINSFIALGRLDNLGSQQQSAVSSSGGGSRSFDNTGAYFQELNLSTNHEKYSLIAGKFNLNFGNAWRWDRGLWIHQIANNYRYIERLGFSGVYRLGNAQKTGQYNFSLSSFTNDRKNLDNSVLVNRDSTHKTDGTPGDTRSLSSYNASLNINFDFGPKEKLSYNFSYIDLVVNKRASPVAATKVADQKGFVVGMNYTLPWQENLDFDFLIEYASMKNLGGNSDITESYFTTNLITRLHQNWSMLLGTSQRKREVLFDNGTNQNLSEVSLGYDFDKTKFFDRLTLQAGYRFMRTDNKEVLDLRDTLGVMLRYYKNF